MDARILLACIIGFTGIFALCTFIWSLIFQRGPKRIKNSLDGKAAREYVRSIYPSAFVEKTCYGYRIVKGLSGHLLWSVIVDVHPTTVDDVWVEYAVYLINQIARNDHDPH